MTEVSKQFALLGTTNHFQYFPSNIVAVGHTIWSRHALRIGKETAISCESFGGNKGLNSLIIASFLRKIRHKNNNHIFVVYNSIKKNKKKQQTNLFKYSKFVTVNNL